MVIIMNSLAAVEVIVDGHLFIVNLTVSDKKSVIAANAEFNRDLKAHEKDLKTFMAFGDNGKVHIDQDEYARFIDGIKNPSEKLVIINLVASFKIGV